MICKLPPLQKEGRQTYTHNTQLKADKHQAVCHILRREPKVEVLISGVGSPGLYPLPCLLM